MSIRPNIVFFGNERLSSGFDATNAPVLRRLISDGYSVSAVVCNFEEGRSRKKRPLEISVVAKQHDIPLLLPASPTDIAEQLMAYRAEIAVLVAYGRIIPQTIIDIFPKGIINIHPSALPKYRGSTPIESAILGGDTSLTVSLMQLARQMDAGPVYAQRSITIDDTLSKHNLTQQALELGADMFTDLLPAILDGSLEPTTQDETQASYCALIKKTDGLIEWNKSAVEITREIRAYLGWPGSKARLFEQEVTILEARTVVNDAALVSGEAKITDGRLLVGTAKGALEIQKLRPAGRSTMNASDFLRGLRSITI